MAVTDCDLLLLKIEKPERTLALRADNPCDFETAHAARLLMWSDLRERLIERIVSTCESKTAEVDEMTTSLGKLSLIALAFCVLNGVTNAQTQSQARASRFEVATFFGAMIAGKQVGRGVNATGGEQLIARLDHGGALGLRAGVHSELIGLEANFLTTGNAVVVKNEFGVLFPHHAETPLLYSGEALLYPLRRAIREGRVRPYVTSGIGGMLISADLDNINDQEPHHRLMWNAGGGVKLFAGEAPAVFVDVRFTNHRLLGSRGTGAIDLRSIAVGVGYRF